MTPVLRPVGEAAVLVEFGEARSDATSDSVAAFDAALTAAAPDWLVETVPAYCSVLVVFDPLLTGFEQVSETLLPHAAAPAAGRVAGRVHEVAVRYDEAPDLATVAAHLGISVEEAITLHLSGEYRVHMYGFAPGYAYLGGVPHALRLPRKSQPVRGHPPGSVLIAGEQCLVTTLAMPTGWWVIGHTDVAVLRPDEPEPFLFAPGDRVRFVRER